MNLTWVKMCDSLLVRFVPSQCYFLFFRWKKYTEDMPKEQHIWYLEPYNESTSGSSEEDINFDRR